MLDDFYKKDLIVIFFLALASMVGAVAIILLMVR